MSKHKKSQEIPKTILYLSIFMLVVFLLSLFLLFGLFRISSQLFDKNISNKAETSAAVKVVKTANLTNNSIFIDIEGAVVKPGVYELPSSSRLIDALLKAEGLLEKADRYQLARNFNLAKKLSDEEKIYIPFVEERQIFIPDNLSTNFFSINSASSTQLELLPGIGPVTAQKIIDNRPYSTIEELLTKKVLGEKTFEKIKAQLVL